MLCYQEPHGTKVCLDLCSHDLNNKIQNKISLNPHNTEKYLEKQKDQRCFLSVSSFPSFEYLCYGSTTIRNNERVKSRPNTLYMVSSLNSVSSNVIMVNKSMTSLNQNVIVVNKSMTRLRVNLDNFVLKHIIYSRGV